MTAPIERRLLPDSAAVSPSGALSLGGCDVADVAAEFATPTFIYDEQHLRDRCREAVDAFGAGNVVYATKAFLCAAMAQLAHEEGLLLDVATGGELHVALCAGVPAERLVMHGNNKSLAEIEMAINAGVRHLVVDSFDELDRLEAVHARGIGAPRIQLRITPGVAAHTHAYIATGQDDSKFGFNLGNGDAAAAVDRVMSGNYAELIGVHCHIGSNVFDASSFGKAAQVMAEFAVPLDLPELTMGGGLGVPYVAGEEAPTIAAWASVMLDACKAAGVTSRVMVEPGRALVAAAAITVYSVGTIKTIPGVQTYVAVDGGMSDNPRPVLYGSGYEAFAVGDVNAEREMRAKLVGKHCESGDVLIFDAAIPAHIAVGDLLAVPVTGAYGHSMGSNYNKVLRPPVVFVRDGDARLVVRRETYEDLMRCEVI